MRTENLKFRTDLGNWVMDGWSVTQRMIIFSSKFKLLKKIEKNLQIENWSLSNQCMSLYGFQLLHFICYWFVCKAWLLLIQNHSQDHFQVFAHLHLKSLCYLSGIKRLSKAMSTALVSVVCNRFSSFPWNFFNRFSPFPWNLFNLKTFYGNGGNLLQTKQCSLLCSIFWSFVGL